MTEMSPLLDGHSYTFNVLNALRCFSIFSILVYLLVCFTHVPPTKVFLRLGE